jgi:hypothetical protein
MAIYIFTPPFHAKDLSSIAACQGADSLTRRFARSFHFAD